MKHKKVMLVACLLLAVLTIGSVSAIEDATISYDAVELSQDVDDALTVEDSQEDALENQVEESIASDDADDVLSYDASDSNVVSSSPDDYSADDYISIMDTIDAGCYYDYIASVNDPDDNPLNGTVTLSIDGNQYYKKEFRISDDSYYDEICPDDLKGINVFADDFLGNHTVKVTYNNFIKESVVSFVFEPYYVYYYEGAIGEESYIVFRAPGNFKGSATLYNAVYNYTTDEYEAGTEISTYSISAYASAVPLPALTEEKTYEFYVKYTIDGKNGSGEFDVYAFKNSKEVSANISQSEIYVGESVTVTLTAPDEGSIWFSVDGKNSGSNESTIMKQTYSDLTEGTHLIYASYYLSYSSYVKYFVVTVKKNIADAKVALSKNAFTYNAKVQKPTVTLKNGAVLLKEGVDYTLKWSASPKNVGTYTITVTGIGAYKGTTKATFKINKAANPLKVKAKTAKVKFSKVKNKKQVLAVSKVVKFTKKGQGTLTYKKASGNKKITINKKTGKVTVAQGLKKGTYKVKVKIKAKGNANYKASTFKTVTFKIIIK